MPTGTWSWPGLRGGIVNGKPELLEDLPSYVEGQGYRLVNEGASPTDLHDRLTASPAVGSLRGRGGAGFPFWAKMEIVHREAVAAGRVPVVVANGAEGEPLSVKDRYVMRHRPHLVLDGAALAARALGAEAVHLYACDEQSLATLATAHAEAAAAGIPLPHLEFHVAQDTFVAGEATAAVRAINTRVARPIDHPPRMSRRGVGEAPTLVSNVETLARLARATMPEPPSGASPLLVTLSGGGVSPAVIEVPYGLSVAELLQWGNIGAESGHSALVGGFFGGVIPVTADLQLSLESLTERGGALGCASLHLIGKDDDPIRVASAVADYYAGHTARQCRSCVESTKDIALALRGHGGSAEVVLPRLGRWSTQIVGRGACAVPDGVAMLLSSLLRHYPQQLQAHLASPAGDPLDPATFRVDVPSPRLGALTSAGGVA
jgi:NADH:ubiquinone oxidoreductase subunit F (NADH-binding)